MADIREKQFWINLLKKLLKTFLKQQGIKTSPDTHHQHVVPHEDGWAVKGEGNTRHSGTYRKQSTAIRRAKRIAKNYNADVIIHRQDGTIRDRISPKPKKR